MDIWHSWVSLLGHGLGVLSSQLGLSEALAIVLLTLLARCLLMPLSVAAVLRGELRKERLRALRPELDALARRHAGDRAELAAATMALYRTHGIRFVDRITLANAGVQGVFGVGLFQAIGKAAYASRFLWIGNLSKPDVLLTALVSVLMLAATAVMPGAVAEPSAALVLGAALVVTAATLAFMPSAVGLYWAASNATGLAQAVLVRVVLRRRRLAGAAG